MQFHMPKAELYIPDGTPEAEALARTTHLGIGAHQDDLEIMSYHGILAGFGQSDVWYGGVVVTNGAGNPRAGLYGDYTDEQMQYVRRLEQRKAAHMGEYSFQAQLDFPSAIVKSPTETQVIEDLQAIINATSPRVMYVHNLADKHDTHVASALRTIAALRELPAEQRPEQLLGCEVWRDLDWVVDEEKVALDVSEHENLAQSLVGVFDSSVAGGKRYDLATMGRRRAHATYFESHGVDITTGLNFAMDLTPLIQEETLAPFDYVAERIARFQAEVQARIEKLTE
ncbi:MAG: PIG-L family deacetylase [candidate division WS1 bacterium]|nr:PIG-L family deacetylase [candidate division WS1 bacterium]